MRKRRATASTAETTAAQRSQPRRYSIPDKKNATPSALSSEIACHASATNCTARPAGSVALPALLPVAAQAVICSGRGQDPSGGKSTGIASQQQKPVTGRGRSAWVNTGHVGVAVSHVMCDLVKCQLCRNPEGKSALS